MRDLVTVIITHYHNPLSMLLRATDSVHAQTVEPLMLVTRNEPESYRSWYNAIAEASTEYVAILHDDDWYEPEFIEATLSYMRPNCGFVFTDAVVHFADRTVRNHPDAPDGYVESASLAADLRDHGAIVSPSCALLRRSDALNTLIPGGVPLAEKNGIGGGPDMLLTALLLLKYPCVRFIAEPLVNFSAHKGSATMRYDPQKLKDNYATAWRFFDAIKGAL